DWHNCCAREGGIRETLIHWRRRLAQTAARSERCLRAKIVERDGFAITDSGPRTIVRDAIQSISGDAGKNGLGFGGIEPHDAQSRVAQPRCRCSICGELEHPWVRLRDSDGTAVGDVVEKRRSIVAAILRAT